MDNLVYLESKKWEDF